MDEEHRGGLYEPNAGILNLLIGQKPHEGFVVEVNDINPVAEWVAERTRAARVGVWAYRRVGETGNWAHFEKSEPENSVLESLQLDVVGRTQSRTMRSVLGPMIEELKKLKVFVSSVQNELEDERLIVQNLLNTDPFLSAHCSPVLYEFEPASPDRALEKSPLGSHLNNNNQHLR